MSSLVCQAANSQSHAALHKLTSQSSCSFLSCSTLPVRSSSHGHCIVVQCGAGSTWGGLASSWRMCALARLRRPLCQAGFVQPRPDLGNHEAELTASQGAARPLEGHERRAAGGRAQRPGGAGG